VSFKKEDSVKKLIFALLLFPVFACAQSPFDGTWKIDISAVKLPEKTESWVLQNGTYQEFTSVPKVNIKADGTDQKVPGAKDYDTLAVKVVNDKTVEFTCKKAGKVVSSGKHIVSADDKSLAYEFINYPVASPQPIKGKLAYSRVSAGPAGSHAISGSWRAQKFAAVSENALITTIKTTSDGQTYTQTTGESYDAKYDGKDYPMKGTSAGITVALKKVDSRTVTTTVKRDGEIQEINTMIVSADGKTATIKVENKVQGTNIEYKSIKQ
jgi:hypothetical protein